MSVPQNTEQGSDNCDPPWLTGPLVVALLAQQSISRPSSCTDEQLEQLGLQADTQQIWLPTNVQAIDMLRLVELLGERARRLWPNVVLQPSVASTNTQLLQMRQDAVGQLLTTEYQFGGRGRLGRRWLSPVGRNLCVSMGFSVPGAADRLSGLSLVVGLAVADALVSCGVSEVKLKWPNDLIVMQGDNDYAKLGGILVDVQMHQGFCLAVIGIGLNQGGAAMSRTALDIPIADVAELSPGLSRTEMLARLTNALADYLEQFLEVGFAPMKSAWEALHAFSDRDVQLSRKTATDTEGGQAGEIQVGRVLGVSDSGRLIVRIDGVPVEIDAGDVSLRPVGEEN